MTKQEILKQCSVEFLNGFIIRLPDIQLERKLYQEVAKALTLIGGKWTSGKVQAFVFKENPTKLLESISGGENRNLQKEYQFFETPDDLADELVTLAEIESQHKILEPSAGQGAIVKAITRILPNTTVDCYELMPTNQIFLRKIANVNFIGDDFLQSDESIKYDRIVANPPFSKNQDIDHVKKMYNLLNQNGRMVVITSTHWFTSTNKKETEFKNWLKEIEAERIEIVKGRFKESGTMVGTFILVIDKK
jgi:phospholipid N-methyltransferase